MMKTIVCDYHRAEPESHENKGQIVENNNRYFKFGIFFDPDCTTGYYFGRTSTETSFGQLAEYTYAEF